MKKAVLTSLCILVLVVVGCGSPATDVDNSGSTPTFGELGFWCQIGDWRDLDALGTDPDSDFVHRVEAYQLEGWTGTVYVRADGSIDPPDAPLMTSDNITYYLTGDISSPGHGIIVQRSNITIEGGGHRVVGPGRTYPHCRGVDLSGGTNVTIRNMQVEDFYHGIYAEGSPNNTISGCTALNNYSGIRLRLDSHNYTITGCTISSNLFTGFHSYYSHNNVIKDNVFSKNRWGIVFDTSHNNTLTNNTMIRDGVIPVGLNFQESINTMDETNTVNGKPVYYWRHRNGGTVPEGAGLVFLVNCQNVEISSQNVSETDLGIWLMLSDNCRVGDVTASSNDFAGIWLSYSESNTVENSVLENNAWYGIYVWASDKNVVRKNTIRSNRWFGIRTMFGSDSNIIYHNNVVNNDVQAQVNDNLINAWDDGYPSGGNYWSDYAGVDLYGGPDQNEPGGDGIGDAPYVIDSNNVDRYPLMQPFEVTVEYYLNISSTDGGSVTTPGEGTFSYDAGTVVNLVATPGSGYKFVNWTGNVSTVANVTAASTTITMNGNYSITANFAPIPPVQYSLTISSTPGGTVIQPGLGTFTYNAGTVVNLVAAPLGGYRFVNWTGNVGTVANVTAASTTITMNGNYSITANFAEAARQCIATSTRTGTACFTPSHGTLADLQAVPAPSPVPHGVRFPHGMFSFRITGLAPLQSVTLTVEFPDPIPTHWVWWKYRDGEWSRLRIDRTTDPRIIRVTLTDGGAGDFDNVPGQITDPGGPGDPGSVGWETYPINKARVLLPWIVLLAAIVGCLSLLALWRQGRVQQRNRG